MTTSHPDAAAGGCGVLQSEHFRLLVVGTRLWHSRC